VFRFSAYFRKITTREASNYHFQLLSRRPIFWSYSRLGQVPKSSFSGTTEAERFTGQISFLSPNQQHQSTEMILQTVLHIQKNLQNNTTDELKPGGILQTVAGCQPYRWLQLGL